MAPKEGSPVRNLLIHGSLEIPHVVLPQKIDPPIVSATNLNSVPPVVDALLARSDGRPAMLVTTQTSIPKQELLPNIPHAETVKNPSIEIFAVTFGPTDNVKDGVRKLARGQQRIGQYERLLGIITNAEIKLQRRVEYQYGLNYEGTDGEMHHERYRLDEEAVRGLRKVANSFAANELDKEAFTKTLADKITAKMGMQKDEVVAEAERIIADFQRPKFTEIAVKKTVITEDTAPTQTKKADKKEDQKNSSEEKQKEEKAADKNERKEVEFTGENVLAAVEYMVTIDRPSPEAAEELRTIWERPF